MSSRSVRFQVTAWCPHFLQILPFAVVLLFIRQAFINKNSNDSLSPTVCVGVNSGTFPLLHMYTGTGWGKLTATNMAFVRMCQRKVCSASKLFPVCVCVCFSPLSIPPMFMKGGNRMKGIASSGSEFNCSRSNECVMFCNQKLNGRCTDCQALSQSTGA